MENTQSKVVLLNIGNFTAREIDDGRFTIKVVTTPATMISIVKDKKFYDLPLANKEAEQFVIELLGEFGKKDFPAILDGEINTSGSGVICHATRIIITEGLIVASHVSRD